ncbi:putative ribonuclease H-like domain-containing protein [Tanacetum coccineum]
MTRGHWNNGSTSQESEEAVLKPMLFKDFVVYQMDVKSAFCMAIERKFIAWYETLSTYLLENGFRRGTIDKTLFIKDKGDILLVKVYVDDIIFGSTKNSLCVEFEQTIQDKYVADILKKFDFITIKIASTPIETNKALLKDEEAKDMDRIFRYLKGQPKLGLWYPRDSPFNLEAFSDSDYARSSLDRKSTTGGCQFHDKRLIPLQCKKQTIVANSTTEAEYVAATNCCGQVLWIQNQMLDYGFNLMNTKIHIDNNESTICIVKNPVFHSKTKHIEIRHHFIRDSYEKKLIQVIKIHTDHNVSNLLTKAFDVSKKAKRTTEISQSSRPIHLDADETVYKEWEDRMERAATTASSLEAEQDNGIINRTQSIATLNESFPQGTDSGSGPSRGRVKVQDNPLNPNQHLPLLHPLMKYKLLLLHHIPKRLAHLGEPKEVGTLRFLSLVVPLRRLVMRLSIQERMTEWLGLPLTTAVLSITKVESRKVVTSIRPDPRQHLMNHLLRELDLGRWTRCTHSWGCRMLRQVETATKHPITHLSLEVNNILRSGEDSIEHQDDLTDFVPPTPHDSPLSGGHTPGSDEGRPNINELMAIFINLLNRVLALETSKTALPIFDQKVKKESQKIGKEAKGKNSRDEILFKIGTSKRKILDKKDYLRQGRGFEDKANNLMIFKQGWMQIALLAARLQEEERENFSIDEQARFLVENNAERQEIQNLYEREQKWINDFVPIDSKVVKDSRKGKAKGCRKKTIARKRKGEKLDDKSVKIQKIEDDAEKEELRAYLDIIPGDDEAVNVESLATKYPIVKWKTHILIENKMQDVLDLYRLVKERFETASPKGYDRLLWRDLITVFEPSEDDEIWKAQQN